MRKVELRGSSEKRLIAVTWSGDAKPDEEKKRYFDAFVRKQLHLTEADGRVVVRMMTAKRFLGEELSLATVAQFFPQAESLFDEITPAAEPT